MFNVLFLFCILGGLILGVRISMRHADLYLRLLKTSENTTIAAVGDVDNTFYDTEQVNQMEVGSDEKINEDASIQQSLITEDLQIDPDQVRSYAEMETTFTEENMSVKTDEDVAFFEGSSDVPVLFSEPAKQEGGEEPQEIQEADEKIAESHVEEENQEKKIPEKKQKVQNDSPDPVESSSHFEIISELSDFPKEWLPASEATQEITQMTGLAADEMQILASIGRETQEMLLEFENASSDAVETQWISNASEAKYVNRVICRPRIGVSTQ